MTLFFTLNNSVALPLLKLAGVQNYICALKNGLIPFFVRLFLFLLRNNNFKLLKKTLKTKTFS